MAADGIFISYRREESAGVAGRLYDRLVARFGRARVFMDVEGIDPGTDFVEAIERAVSSCRALIVIIGPRWTTVRGSDGQRRLDDPRDFVRLETSAALNRGIRVLPVLVDGAAMPREADLPEDLIPLVRRQAIEVNHKHWESSTNDLLRALAQVLDEDESSMGDRIPTHRRWGFAALLASLPLLAILALAFWTPGQQPAQEAAELDPAAVAATPAGEAAPETPAEIPAPPPVTDMDPIPLRTAPAQDETAASETAPAQQPVRVPTRPAESVTPVPTVVAASPKAEPAVTAAPQRVLPTAEPPPSPDPAAAVATIEPSIPSPLPQPGEQWTYSIQGMWPTNRERTYVFGIEATDDEVIRETMTEITPSGTRSLPAVRWTGAKPEVVQRPGKLPEFSPYLAAFEGISDSTRWRGVSTPSYSGQWDGWHTTGRVVRFEDVSVPAGQFRAWKAEIWSTRSATGGLTSARLEPVTVRYEIWFAPSEKRYVKLVRTIESAANSNIERDVFELRSVSKKD
jgi:hypothetical protein